jgi:primosomal protein N' (replication factor Y)
MHAREPELVEEIGRAFPGASVVGSWAGSRIESLPAAEAASGRLVVATPGCIPDPGPLGYQLAVILDATAALSRPGLRTGEMLLSQWLAMAALVRPSSAGGRVVLVGPAAAREVQALLRWDPLGYAMRELEERQRAGLPPGVRAVSLTGSAHAVAEAVAEVAAGFDRATGDDVAGPAGLRISGPIPLPAEGAPDSSPAKGEGGERTAGSVRWVVSAPLVRGGELAAAVAATQMARSARKAAVVTHRMDPRSLL